MCTWKKRKTLFKKLSPRRLLLNFYIIDKCWWFQQELSNIKTKLVFTNFIAGYIFEGRGLFLLPAVRAFFNFDFNESLLKWQKVNKITCIQTWLKNFHFWCMVELWIAIASKICAQVWIVLVKSSKKQAFCQLLTHQKIPWIVIEKWSFACKRH